MCLKLTVMTPEQRQWHLSGIFIFSAAFTHSSGVSIGDFEQVNAGTVDEL